MRATSVVVLVGIAGVVGACGDVASRPTDGDESSTQADTPTTVASTSGEAGDDTDGSSDGTSSSSAQGDDSTEGSSTGEPGCGADLCEHDGVCGPCDTSYWADVDQPIATTPYGHRTAIACHNCYAETLNGTLAAIHAAQADGADLIELDLTDEGGMIIVEHDDGGGADGPTLVEVLADPALREGLQPLNIELKESAPTEEFVAGVLDAVREAGCVRAGRPLLLRAFATDGRLENLLLTQTLLATPEYADLAPFVRLHALLGPGVGSSTQSLVDVVDENAARGFDGIEFGLGTKELMTAVHYTHSLGMAAGVWTVPSSLGDMHVAALRDELEVITTDYSVAYARARVEADNARIRIDATTLAAGARTIEWSGADADAVQTVGIDGDGRPALEAHGAGDPLFGGSLRFVADEGRSLPVDDIALDEGVLVAALVRFDTVTLPDGETMSVLGKANSGEYALELYNAPGATGTVLRLAVHVAGAYHYATIPSAQLDVERAVWIIAAYDGNGGVHLMIDHSSANTTSENTDGPITPNDAVLQLGADPQDPEPPRFFFDGEIQVAVVQAWP